MSTRFYFYYSCRVFNDFQHFFYFPNVLTITNALFLTFLFYIHSSSINSKLVYFLCPQPIISVTLQLTAPAPVVMCEKITLSLSRGNPAVFCRSRPIAKLYRGRSSQLQLRSSICSNTTQWRSHCGCRGCLGTPKSQVGVYSIPPQLGYWTQPVL